MILSNELRNGYSPRAIRLFLAEVGEGRETSSCRRSRSSNSTFSWIGPPRVSIQARRTSATRAHIADMPLCGRRGPAGRIARGRFRRPTPSRRPSRERFPSRPRPRTPFHKIARVPRSSTLPMSKTTTIDFPVGFVSGARLVDGARRGGRLPSLTRTNAIGIHRCALPFEPTRQGPRVGKSPLLEEIDKRA